MSERGIEIVGGNQMAADDVSWRPPSGAVHPINHFHTLYMRLTEISEGLLHEAGRDSELAGSAAFTELLGACGSLSNTMAHVTHKLEGIRRDFPKVWEAWRSAVQYQPPQKENPKG
jgi:hypothetical protein